MISERHKSRLKVDEIDLVLQAQQYAVNWYQPGLKEAVLGPHSCDLVPVSRYYMTLRPPVVVDFEPSPLDRKFYLEEKRKFFLSRGILYVPILLNERLSKEEFAKRVEDEREYLRTGKRRAQENEALADVPTSVITAAMVRKLVKAGRLGEVLETAAFEAWVNEQALERAQVRFAANSNIRGVAKTQTIAAEKKKLLDELRREALNARVAHSHSGGVTSVTPE